MRRVRAGCERRLGKSRQEVTCWNWYLESYKRKRVVAGDIEMTWNRKIAIFVLRDAAAVTRHVTSEQGRKETGVLGASFLSLCCIWDTSSRMLGGGLAQKTRLCRGSTKPGSMLGSSSLWRMESRLRPLKSATRRFALCWELRVVRWIEYRTWICF